MSEKNFKKLQEDIYIVLSMLKEKDKEIEHEKKKNKELSNQLLMFFKEKDNLNDKIIRRDKEIESLKSQIDLMAECMYQEGTGRRMLSCIFGKECIEEGCRVCIKQYFEKKVEEWKN